MTKNLGVKRRSDKQSVYMLYNRPMRPSALWKEMSPEKRLAAANAFWTDEHGHEQQVEVIVTLARKMNFRPKSVPALPLERRAKLLAGMDVSDAVASA